MYQLNIEAARLAEQRSSRITAPGAYEGQFMQAVEVTSPHKTRGIELVFETENKARAYFTLWTLDIDKKELYGYRYLNALMVCLGLEKLESEPGAIRKWEENEMVNKRVQVFKALLDKEIGVLLDTEEYEKRDGGIGIRVAPVGFFCTSTKRMASEILDQTREAEQLKELSKMLKHRPLKKSNIPFSRESCATAPSPLSDIDDDISF
ncbi:Putative uncharacterized protein [Mycoavidus cysteinexigens]|uniref:Uncharacterized protein n=1 Tax=Mycoavidus cysteinexigens TaxID=1553431 RepID=A0A2Z6EXC9_9BURK|nr:hypothetical protein [Mycoavidus cysteinexigens]BBE09745.1 Putative uncharacterized protein [Mycoavidus cysteinexigens]GAM53932.1 hypothetical protein EBME_2395 [bacterium endosymbiont of Mortierella elongata FMR23-6]GLR02237.1 hypothetical protein GCM10007934_20520 [Mycoavidus cysteinexigens]